MTGRIEILDFNTLFVSPHNYLVSTTAIFECSIDHSLPSYIQFRCSCWTLDWNERVLNNDNNNNNNINNNNIFSTVFLYIQTLFKKLVKEGNQKL